MDAISFVLGLLYHNPVFAGSLLAAVFLGAVALGSGWARADFAPLLRASGLFTLLAASSFAVVLLFLERTLALPLPAGLVRLPLYALALSYGSSAGLVGGFCFLAFSARSIEVTLGDSVILLELMVLGWLARAPRPGSSRWLGPLYALAAYALAWATAGVALLQWSQGGLGALSLWERLGSGLPGVLVTAALLALSPKVYELIAPPHEAAPPEARGVKRPRRG